ncbi:uncharacterized protein RVIR1_13190 [Candidatus Rickettsiella viridis]|uniref:Uncharacterized protein n=2 Tax=Candidatus Rickettsiella viridis TaxID=676208 RepID=A0A2Z5UVX4_9COXI|nr:uncharacterized protein RVIR1_13190 [Candidatus Rickettsiella viridis]
MLNPDTYYASAGEGQDVYSLDINEFTQRNNLTIIINNYAIDDLMDIFEVNLDYNAITLAKNIDNLRINLSIVTSQIANSLTVQVEDFFKHGQYQHFSLKTKHTEDYLWLPLYRAETETLQFYPYYFSTEKQSFFNIVAESLVNNALIVLAAHSERIFFYRQQQDLLLIESVAENQLEFSIKFKDYFSEKITWPSFTIYFRKDDVYLVYNDILALAELSLDYQDEISVFQENEIKFYLITLNFQEKKLIYHNQKFLGPQHQNDSVTLDPDERQTAVLELDFFPEQIKLSVDNNDLMLFFRQKEALLTIKNWHNPIHRIARIHFLHEFPVTLFGIEHFQLTEYKKLEQRLNQGILSSKLDGYLAQQDSQLVNALILLLASAGLAKKQNLLSECLGFTSNTKLSQFVTVSIASMTGEDLLQYFIEENYSALIRISVLLIARAISNEIVLSVLSNCFYLFPQASIQAIRNLVNNHLDLGADQTCIAIVEWTENEMDNLTAKFCQQLNLPTPIQETQFNSTRHFKRSIKNRDFFREIKFPPVASQANRMRNPSSWFLEQGHSFYLWLRHGFFSNSQANEKIPKKIAPVYFNAAHGVSLFQDVLQLFTLTLFRYKGFRYYREMASPPDENEALQSALVIVDRFRSYLAEIIHDSALLRFILDQDEFFLCMQRDMSKLMAQVDEINPRVLFNDFLEQLIPLISNETHYFRSFQL